MTTSIRSEATRSVVEVNGIDVLSIKPDGAMELLATTGLVDTHIPMLRQVAAKATTSGTFVDFSPADGTGIPSWVKRVTIALNGTSLSGTSQILLQLGAGSVETTGYVSSGSLSDSAATVSSSTAGFVVRTTAAANAASVLFTLVNVSGNVWVCSHTGTTGSGSSLHGGGNKTLTSTLDRLRITTVNGTDTFDAGSVSVIYEG